MKDSQPAETVTVTLNARFDSLGSYQEAIPEWDVQFRQLEGGRLHADLLQIASASTIFTRTNLSCRMHQEGESPPGMLAFGLIQDRGPEIAWCRQQANHETLECFETAGSFEAVTRPGFDVFTLAIHSDRLQSLLELHEIRSPVSVAAMPATVLRPQNQGAAKISGLCRELIAATTNDGDTDRTTVASRIMDHELPAALASALDGGSIEPAPPSFAARRRVRERAVAYMRENARDAPAIATICEELRVSWRLLDYAFKDYYGVTPKAYLKMLQLDGLRADLAGAEQKSTVTELAGDWGFSHFGQLSVDYRKRFGERPSDTLRNRKARVCSIPG